MQYTGTLKYIMEPQRISAKFVKREFVVSDVSQTYPQTILFEVVNDNCRLLDEVKVGEEVTVHFKLKGREWVNPNDPEKKIKYFTTLVANEVLLTKAKEQETIMPQDDNLDLPF